MDMIPNQDPNQPCDVASRRVAFIGGTAAQRARRRIAVTEFGWSAVGVASLSAAAQHVREELPDAVVLTDSGLDYPLLDALAHLIELTDAAVVVLLSEWVPATAEVALRLGAADVQPDMIGSDELCSRLDAILRRRRGSSTARAYRFADVVVDVDGRRLIRASREVPLAPVRLDMLIELVRHPNVVVTFARLHAMSRRNRTSIDAAHVAHTVTEHVRHIRLAIEASPRHPRWIRTVRGIGYRFDPGVGEREVPADAPVKPARVAS
jgi:DNA-binding response OmpR family regulator